VYLLAIYVPSKFQVIIATRPQGTQLKLLTQESIFKKEKKASRLGFHIGFYLCMLGTLTNSKLFRQEWQKFSLSLSKNGSCGCFVSKENFTRLEEMSCFPPIRPCHQNKGKKSSFSRKDLSQSLVHCFHCFHSMGLGIL
jgi:hypothetical protein